MLLKVLVACEFSGKVRDAFRKHRHEAYSCDLLESEKNIYHFQDDIFNILKQKYLGPWDLMICFPPCTHLCVSGARWFKDKKKEQAEAIKFVEKLWNTDIPKIAIENPIGVLSTKSKLGKPAQIIQPWMFGHGETKATCLWVKGLPLLKPTNIVKGREARIHKMAPSKDRSLLRSITYDGIAEAMAEQWG